MAERGSLAARHALLDEWRASGDPRAALMEKQLAYREIAWANRSTKPARQLDNEITKLIAAHGRAWAGRVAELVDDYEFHRGLVGEVTLSGDRFVQVAAELLELAPIQHVNLVAPISMSAVAALPQLAGLSTLHADALGGAVGDAGAIALATSPHVRNLAQLSLRGDAITRAGVDALASSKFLASLRHLSLIDNPADPTPYVRDEGDGEYSAGRPALAVELEKVYGPRPWLAVPSGHLPSWPGRRDDFGLVADHVSDRVLADLEDLAAEVDRLAASDDEGDQVTAGARRGRLLIELDVSGLLAGTDEVGARLANRPTLRGYHEAAVALLSYLASAARIRLVATAIGSKVIDSNISLDWFRVPSGYTPPGVSPHDWLALCERNFIDPMPSGGGTRYVRLEGKMHQLLFRPEVGPAPRLWRAVPA
jgi:hypothetical protein